MKLASTIIYCPYIRIYIYTYMYTYTHAQLVLAEAFLLITVGNRNRFRLKFDAGMQGQKFHTPALHLARNVSFKLGTVKIMSKCRDLAEIRMNYLFQY